MSYEKKNMLGCEARNVYMLDMVRLFDVARERERKLRESMIINFKVEKNNISLEDLYKSDLVGKTGFVIETETRYEKQGAVANLIELDSLFSYKFGVKESDPASVKEKRYTCNCKTDNIKESGEWCDKCKSYAIEHKYTRGWILLEHYKVFNPDLLNIFIKNKKPGVELKKPKSYNPDSSNPDKYPWLSNPDFKYNILNLQDRNVLVEFINEYSKPENIDWFLERIDMFMTSKIPVVSKNLRHHHVITKMDGTPNVRSHPINFHLMLINNKVDELNNGGFLWSSGRILRFLSDINREFSSIHDEVFKILGDGKSSDLRGKVGGVRKGHSAKVIIEGAMDHVTHVCTCSYASFGVMFIDWHYDLFVEHGMTSESEFRIRRLIPNKDDFPILTKVLKDLQKLDLAWLAGYRPPTLYRCSWQGMYITGLTFDGAIRVTEINLGENFKGDHDKFVHFISKERECM